MRKRVRWIKRGDERRKERKKRRKRNRERERKMRNERRGRGGKKIYKGEAKSTKEKEDDKLQIKGKT